MHSADIPNSVISIRRVTYQKNSLANGLAAYAAIQHFFNTWKGTYVITADQVVFFF
jgi:hypothetical protein